MGIDEFMKRFNFCKEKKLFVGVERECHLIDENGAIVPMAAKVLENIKDDHFGYELSACQLESRTNPVKLKNLKDALIQNERVARSVLDALSLGCSHKEVAPFDMPIDVYPDPTGRYQQIVKNMPVEILRAACRVIGTHIHIGMPDHETALKVYNRILYCGYVRELVSLGDGSNGERLKIYRVMAPDANPNIYESWDNFYSVACAKGFDQDPRKCWSLIRISVHGTIEFRMFGTTDDIDTIVGWAARCRDICKNAFQPLLVHSSFGSGEVWY